MARVEARGATVFEPALALRLTPQLLSLADGSPLTVAGSVPEKTTRLEPAALHLRRLAVPVAAARTTSALMALAAAVAGAVLLVLARRAAAVPEAERIRREHAALLLPVHPMALPPGRPAVDVTDFPTLARLAQRYGLMVLHWSRGGVETFLVQDDGMTYRYRTGAVPLDGQAPGQPAGPVDAWLEEPVARWT